MFDLPDLMDIDDMVPGSQRLLRRQRRFFASLALINICCDLFTAVFGRINPDYGKEAPEISSYTISSCRPRYIYSLKKQMELAIDSAVMHLKVAGLNFLTIRIMLVEEKIGVSF